MYNKKYMDVIRPYREVHWLYDWNLLWRHVEGMALRYGVNWMWDNTSKGFVIRIGQRGFRVRWSVRVKKLFVSFQRYTWSEGAEATIYLWGTPQQKEQT